MKPLGQTPRRDRFRLFARMLCLASLSHRALSLSTPEESFLQALFPSHNDPASSLCSVTGITCGVDALSGASFLQLVQLSGLPGEQTVGGTLPSLQGLSRLKSLKIDKSNLRGTIDSLSSLVALEALDLDNNQLSGTLPSLADCPLLARVDLDKNLFQGTLGDLKLGQGVNTKLYRLELDTNSLSGSVGLWMWEWVRVCVCIFVAILVLLTF